MLRRLRQALGAPLARLKLLRDANLLRGSGWFDEAWYLSTYPDVARAKVDPVLHYLRSGDAEGRDPGPRFSTRHYREAYPDVQRAHTSALVHYLRHGRAEGRAIRADQLAGEPIHTSPRGASVARTPYTDRAVRIFCLSVQRTGTTSVAKFLVDFGYQFAGWPTSLRLGWTDAWYEGAYEAIFSSDEFRLANAYSDAPWFMPDFYRVLFHRFPNARFVLFERDPDAWFRSMQAFFHGEIIGPARIHCRMYRRELEYLELLRSGAIDERIENQVESRKTMKLEGHAAHYKDVYRLHNLEVRDFFRRHAPSSLFYAKLEDPTKWQGLGKFLGLDVPGGYEVHMHDSAQA